MRGQRRARLVALAGAAILALGAAGPGTAATGTEEPIVAGPAELVSVTYYDPSGRVIRREQPRGGDLAPTQNCESLPLGGRELTPQCGGTAPSGCMEATWRHGFSRFFGTVWLYHTVGWCWSNWVVSWATVRNTWRTIEAGICSAGQPVSWRSGGGVGHSYVSFRSQVDASCVGGWVHVTIWMDIGYGHYGNTWAIAWSQH